MNRKNIYYLLLLPVLALMMGACSESNNDEEPSNPDTPVTPVNPGDWQTVPAKGGTIKKVISLSASPPVPSTPIPKWLLQR